MKKKKLIVLVSFIFLMLVFIFNGCSSNPSSSDDGGSGTPTPSNGTITVNLTNAAAANGKTFVAGIYNNGADPMVDPSVDGGSAVIAVGAATYTTGTTFTGGSNYDVWVFVDEDGSGTGGPNAGDKVNTTAIDVSIDGNKTVTVDYTTLGTM